MKAPAPRGQAGLGLMLLAIGRPRGFKYFGATNEAYLNSLAPLAAFALVTGGVTAMAGKPHAGVVLTCVQLISVLCPPVVADVLCRRWAREAAWPLYANVLNWAQLLLMMVISLDSLLTRLLASAGLPDEFAVSIGTIGLAIYAIWLQWFVARGALRLSRWRTAGLLAATLLSTNLLIGLPLLASGELNEILPVTAGGR